MTRAEFHELCDLVQREFAKSAGRIWPRILGLSGSMMVTLAYLRRNRVQAELAEAFGVSQPTISRAITVLTPLLERALSDWVPVAEDIDSDVQHIVDGTLVPCWSWADHPELYSGKHKTTGLNLQVVCDLQGRLVWVSDPVDGRRHDIAALRLSGVYNNHDNDLTDAPHDRPPPWLGDKGYIGADMITPIRKPPHRDLLDWEKQFNTDVNKIRYKIERAIAHIKNWNILHTDYRRPFHTFATTISAVLGLEA